MTNNRKRSPLRNRPLPLPGESVETRRQDLILDKVTYPLLMAGVLIAFAINEVMRDMLGSKPSPLFASFVALVAVAYAVLTITRVLPELAALRLARDGERVVGQLLEELRTQGYQVFHDVAGIAFNVDHLLVGPAGVFTIETKTRSKPVGRDAKVTFDGEAVLVDGYESDRNPVVQAKAQARWVGELLAESTGRRFPVRPVILFPGWYVEQAPGAYKEVWVLTPRALPGFLSKQKQSLSQEEISQASFHLKAIIRSTTQE